MKGKTLCLVGLLLGLAFGMAWPGDAVETTGLRIISTPSTALYGEPFHWKVTGLKPGERVTVKASSQDARRIIWRSEAAYEADPSGTVDLERQAPVAGSYEGADIFGLLWSMKPAEADPKKPIRFRPDGVNGWMVDLTATDSAGAAASTRFRCVYQRPGEPIVRVPLEQDGLRGFFYRPAKGGPFPGLIVLGGSEGGLYEGWALALASNGFAVLNLAYFGYQGLPDELVEIPLEYFDRAAAWMKAQPQVRPGGLGLVGGSKGGEAALLLASHNKEFRAVAAFVPAAHMWEGHTQRFYSPDYKPVSSWSLGGKPTPFITFKVTPQDKEKEKNGTLDSYVFYFRDGLAQEDPARVAEAAIPVERINGPILLVSGTDDRTWPSGDFCELIKARLKKAGFSHEVKHLSNEGGGHSSMLPFLIPANWGEPVERKLNGGSPKTDVQGGYRSWSELTAFLLHHLDR